MNSYRVEVLQSIELEEGITLNKGAFGYLTIEGATGHPEFKTDTNNSWDLAGIPKSNLGNYFTVIL